MKLEKPLPGSASRSFPCNWVRMDMDLTVSSCKVECALTDGGDHHHQFGIELEGGVSLCDRIKFMCLCTNTTAHWA